MKQNSQLHRIALFATLTLSACTPERVTGVYMSEPRPASIALASFDWSDQITLSLAAMVGTPDVNIFPWDIASDGKTISFTDAQCASFVWTAGRLHKLPMNCFTEEGHAVRGVNSKGQAVTSRAWLWQSGITKVLDRPCDAWLPRPDLPTTAESYYISESGVIAGTAVDSTCRVWGPALWVNDRYVDAWPASIDRDSALAVGAWCDGSFQMISDAGVAAGSLMCVMPSDDGYATSEWALVRYPNEAVTRTYPNPLPENLSGCGAGDDGTVVTNDGFMREGVYVAWQDYLPGFRAVCGQGIGSDGRFVGRYQQEDGSMIGATLGSGGLRFYPTLSEVYGTSVDGWAVGSLRVGNLPLTGSVPMNQVMAEAVTSSEPTFAFVREISIAERLQRLCTFAEALLAGGSLSRGQKSQFCSLLSSAASAYSRGQLTVLDTQLSSVLRVVQHLAAEGKLTFDEKSRFESEIAKIRSAPRR